MAIIDRISRVFANVSADTLIIFNTGTVDSNFLYFTGFTSGVFEDTLLIVKKQNASVLANELEYYTAMSQKRKGLEVIKVLNRKDIEAHMSKSIRGKTIGINGSFMPFSYAKALRKYKPKRIIDASEGLLRARLVKDSEEIRTMKKAVEIAKKAFKEIPKYFKEGITEKQLASTFNYLMGMNGADGQSFPTIVSFGPNSAMPHHMPDDTKLEKNSIVLIDAGAKYKNYCSDLTRSFIFKPDKSSKKYTKIVEMYSIVKEAQRRALLSIKPGADASAPHIAAEEFINSAAEGKYKGTFIHSVGHSIGIDVHDGFGLSKGQHFKLQPGMVFSDEPGIYVEGFGGIRIEDDVLVTKNGSIFL
ncbi:MAG: M24 family metallopeptidase [Candidatus Micrarchaeia archaeon]